MTQAGVPRHRRIARHRCIAGSTLAPDGRPRPVRRNDRAPGRPGTEADAGTARSPPAVQIWFARVSWLLPWLRMRWSRWPGLVADTLSSCSGGDVKTSATWPIYGCDHAAGWQVSQEISVTRRACGTDRTASD